MLPKVRVPRGPWLSQTPSSAASVGRNHLVWSPGTMSALIQSESFFTHKDEYFANLRALVAATDEEEAKKQVDSVAEIVR